MYYKYDFEAQKNLSHKQSVLFYEPFGTCIRKRKQSTDNHYEKKTKCMTVSIFRIISISIQFIIKLKGDESLSYIRGYTRIPYFQCNLECYAFRNGQHSIKKFYRGSN